GWRNFFILTKGDTVYRKTIENFTIGHPKYALIGYTEMPPFELITGEDYERPIVADRLRGLPSLLGEDYINIFVFNVEKTFSQQTEQRRFHGGKTGKSEILGDSMANLLAKLPDLVLLMDESHRYRAEKSMQAVNDLKPLLGLEFTATPIGKNIIYRYDLGQAIRDADAHLKDPSKPSGYIKIPIMLGRQNLHASDEFERTQLQDGIARHRQKKTAVEVYCENNNLPRILPIALVSTKDIKHAEEIREYIESEAFFGGEYAGKTVLTHSKTGELRDDDIAGLMRLEDPSNDKEIVIHVNKLKEGWDVKNIYTIIPLRAAKSDILTEQTIGRGMRLPFGIQTGDDDLDILEIAAHEHFAEIVSEAKSNANKYGGVPIRTKEIKAKDKEETEKRTIAPKENSPYQIDIPKLIATYQDSGRLQDFNIVPRRSFSEVAQTLVGTVLGGTDQRIFDVPAYEMSEDPMRYLVRTVFDEAEGISTSDAGDMKLVPDLIRRYMEKINADASVWKTIVQTHALEIISDIVEQIDSNVVSETHISYEPTGEIIAWKTWSKSVPTGYVAPNYKEAPDDNCRKCLLDGYEKTIYPIAEFDSKQEKWLADILERETKIKRWSRIPTGQMPIFYAAGDYNPDFVVDDDETIYLVEVKSAAELKSETVKRKAKAAIAWCEAVSAINEKKWEYKIIPHDSILQTDSFDGVLSRAFVYQKDLVETIRSGEHSSLEFKSTLRWNIRENKLDKKMEEIILKSISAFNNAEGGKLLIGVNDIGEILGLDDDYKTLKESSKDNFELHLRNLINTAFGKEFAAVQLSIKFPVIDGKEICEIDIKRGKDPLYCEITDKNGGKSKKFYIRSGNSSQELDIQETASYIKNRF
ncbi:MAG TPA: RNA-binding domain-containing protein, partial [Pyrinomonadaceae bacterium]|nr:RNA-binding domain-containing protein [Pyrinomonadaceae bacterium]